MNNESESTEGGFYSEQRGIIKIFTFDDNHVNSYVPPPEPIDEYELAGRQALTFRRCFSTAAEAEAMRGVILPTTGRQALMAISKLPQCDWKLPETPRKSSSVIEEEPVCPPAPKKNKMNARFDITLDDIFVGSSIRRRLQFDNVPDVAPVLQQSSLTDYFKSTKKAKAYTTLVLGENDLQTQEAGILISDDSDTETVMYAIEEPQSPTSTQNPLVIDDQEELDNDLTCYESMATTTTAAEEENIEDIDDVFIPPSGTVAITESQKEAEWDEVEDMDYRESLLLSRYCEAVELQNKAERLAIAAIKSHAWMERTMERQVVKRINTLPLFNRDMTRRQQMLQAGKQRALDDYSNCCKSTLEAKWNYEDYVKSKQLQPVTEQQLYESIRKEYVQPTLQQQIKRHGAKFVGEQLILRTMLQQQDPIE